MNDMTGRVALVTGGGSGIGRATALAFARRGAQVVVADIDDAGAEETAALVVAEGADSSFVHADVADSAQVQTMVGHAVATYGRLDFAVNNAGIGGPLLDTADYAEDAWHRLISINLTGVFLCLKYEISGAAARRRRGHRQHGLDHGPRGHAGWRRLRRLEARGGGPDQGGGAGVWGARHPGVGGLPRLHRHTAPRAGRHRRGHRGLRRPQRTACTGTHGPARRKSRPRRSGCVRTRRRSSSGVPMLVDGGYAAREPASRREQQGGAPTLRRGSRAAPWSERRRGRRPQSLITRLSFARWSTVSR